MRAVGTVADAVRKFCAGSGTVRKPQIRDALGLTANQVDGAVDNLFRRGFLKRISKGVYQFEAKRAAPSRAKVSDRIWRAMRYNPTFSASDVERQAGTTTSYFYKVLRSYRAKGFVAAAGTQKGHAGYWEKVWRLTLKGRNQIERPEVEEFSPDPLVVKAVALNRLICTGLAMATEEDREKAVKLCAELIVELKGIGMQSEKNGEVEG